jgi:hypothetical protein
VWPEVLAANRRLFSSVRIGQTSTSEAFPVVCEYAESIGSHPAMQQQTIHATVSIDDTTVFRELLLPKASRNISPNLLQGQIIGAEGLGTVAAALNHTVVAMAPLYRTNTGAAKFCLYFDPAFLSDSPNDLTFYGCKTASDGNMEFLPLQHETMTFSLDGEDVTDGSGRPLKKEQARLVGAIDSLNGGKVPGVAYMKGWLGDKSDWTPILAYLVSYDGHQYVGRTNLYREGLKTVSGPMVNAGFETSFRFDGEFSLSKLRLFAIFDGGSFAEVDVNKLGMQ